VGARRGAARASQRQPLGGIRTTDLVQRVQIARRELALESIKLDRYDLLILDDIA